MGVPQVFDEAFVAWLRAETERAWQATEDWSLDDYKRAGLVGSRWRRGTRWTGGLDAAAITAIEQRNDLLFGPQHRLFLQTLHSTTPPMLGANYSGGGGLTLRDRPGFYDWRQQGDELSEQMAGVLEWLAEEIVEQELWRPDWGPRPADVEARTARVAKLIEAAPKLVPIYGHRYVVAGHDVVLSVYGLDTIVYGSDLRDYLLHELQDVLHLDRDPSDVPDLPFWSDLFWS